MIYVLLLNHLTLRFDPHSQLTWFRVRLSNIFNFNSWWTFLIVHWFIFAWERKIKYKTRNSFTYGGFFLVLSSSSIFVFLISVSIKLVFLAVWVKCWQVILNLHSYIHQYIHVLEPWTPLSSYARLGDRSNVRSDCCRQWCRNGKSCLATGVVSLRHTAKSTSQSSELLETSPTYSLYNPAPHRILEIRVKKEKKRCHCQRKKKKKTYVERNARNCRRRTF